MRQAALALAGMLSAGLAPALELDRHRIDIAADPGHAALWLHNPSGHAWRGQARLYRWQQNEDGEQLSEARDLALSPAQLLIHPGQGQRLRLVRLGPAPAGDLRAYRLLLSPAPESPADEPRHSLPVFVHGHKDIDQIRLWVSPSADGSHLLLHNDSAAPASLSELGFIASDGSRQLIWAGLAGYVLPHQTRHWALPARTDRYAGGRFQARLDNQAPALLPETPGQIAAPAGSRL